MIVETELDIEPPLIMKLRLSYAKSLKCRHSYEEYKRVRFETELGRESQEWPLVYEKNMKYVRNKQRVMIPAG